MISCFLVPGNSCRRRLFKTRANIGLITWYVIISTTGRLSRDWFVRSRGIAQRQFRQPSARDSRYSSELVKVLSVRTKKLAFSFKSSDVVSCVAAKTSGLSVFEHVTFWSWTRSKFAWTTHTVKVCTQPGERFWQIAVTVTVIGVFFIRIFSFVGQCHQDFRAAWDQLSDVRQVW